MFFKRFLVVLFLSLLIVSCSEEKAETPVSSTPMETEGEVKEVEESQELVNAANIFPGLSYYDDIDGKHLGVLMAGEVVSFTGKTGENSKGHSFYEVITSENEKVWTWSSYIFEKARPGVVKPGMESFIFSKSNENAVTSKKLEPMTIVAVGSELKNETFIKVAWLTEDKKIMYDKYIVTDNVSYNSADVKVARILNKYKSVDNKDLKVELLSNARSISGVSSDFASYIDFVEQDDFEVSVPDLTQIKEKYNDKVTFENGIDIELTTESANLELTELKYSLLDYIILEGHFIKNEIKLKLFNTSVYNLETLPAELSININGTENYLGVVEPYSIESKDSFEVSFKVLGLESDKNEEYLITFNFVNGDKLQTYVVIDPVVLGGE